MTQETATTQPSQPELPEKIEVTREGLDHLQRQLATLREDQRPDLLKRVQRATLFTDPSVGVAIANGARNDLDQLDERIAHLEELLKRAQVIEPAADSDTVQPGSSMTVRYEDGTEETLTLVGPLEANSSRVSVQAPSSA